MVNESALLRIGEFSRRVGVSPELLRAWEQRYGLVEPVRLEGGFRLYGEEDAERVARMLRGLAEGLSANEAARVAVEPAMGMGGSGGMAAAASGSLVEAVRRFDETGVHQALDEALANFGLDAFLGELILPALARIGDEWERGDLDISHEHFASNLIRGRLMGMARLWGRGIGPLALLACPPGEQHDISLLVFGLLLRSHGWRILFLGADTPIATVLHAANETAPSLVVLCSFRSALFEAEAEALRALTEAAPLLLTGPGATAEVCAQIGAERLDGDIVQAAAAVAGSAPV
jgi:methanogenic corrinoid protein MtbC1